MVSLVTSIKAHEDRAWCVTKHSTLPLIATASSDKSCNIYKLGDNGQCSFISKLEGTHNRSVRTVNFKPPLIYDSSSEMIDLPVLACGSFDSTISVWGIEEPDEEQLNEISDIEDPEMRAKCQVDTLLDPKNEWSLMALIEGHENEVKAVSWNHEGNLLASCSRDKTIWIWETDPETLEEFECIAVLSDHEQDIKHVVWHPTENLLASSSYDDTVRLYKSDEGGEDWSTVGIINGHEGTVWCAQFEHPESPSAEAHVMRIVTCSDDCTIRIWSCKLDSKVCEEKTKEKLPSSIRVDSSAMVWEADTVLPQAHKYAIYSISWSKKTGRIASVGSDGRLVVYKQASGKNWEIETQYEGAHGVNEINSVCWCESSNGNEFITTAGDDGNLKVWKL